MIAENEKRYSENLYYVDKVAANNGPGYRWGVVIDSEGDGILIVGTTPPTDEGRQDAVRIADTLNSQ